MVTAADAKEVSAHFERNGRAFRILVAEDDPLLRDFVSEVLMRAGYVIDVVADGQEATEYLKSRFYDAQILDVQMPYMDGFQVLEAAEQLGTGGPAILMSGNPDLEVAALRRGAFRFLQKPFSAEDLEQALKSALAGSS